MQALVWLIIAHVVVEFMLTTATMQQQLREGSGSNPVRQLNWGAYGRHGLLLFLAVLGALRLETGAPLTGLLPAAFCMAAAHLLIDRLGVWLDGYEPLRRALRYQFGQVDPGLYQLAAWLLTQMLHLVALWTVAGLFFPPFYPLEQISWYLAHHPRGSAPIALHDRISYPLLLLLLGSFGGAHFVRIAIQTFGPPDEIRKVTVTQTVVEQRAERDGSEMAGETRVTSGGATVAAQPVQARPEARTEAAQGTSRGMERSRVVRSEMKEETESPTDLREGTGRWIGILERLLVMILVALNSWQAIGFIVAAKSVARYRQLEHRAFVEYYIVGTLVSLLIGILFGLLLGKAVGTLGAT